jgi:hypothetical protein
MDTFVAGAFLVATVPIFFTARAWWIFEHDPSPSSGRLARVVLYLNSATALIFIVTIVLATSETVPQTFVWRIGLPIACLCICIALLSGLKIRHRLYRAVFISSGILSVGWIIAASLH